MVIAAHSMSRNQRWVASPSSPRLNPTWKKKLGISFPYKFANSLAIGWPQGNPDGMVARQTHAVEWFEDGGSKTIY